MYYVYANSSYLASCLHSLLPVVSACGVFQKHQRQRILKSDTQGIAAVAIRVGQGVEAH